MAVVEGPADGRINTYHIDDKLVPKWNTIKDGGLTKMDEDRVYIVDGREGSGKSVFTLQQAAYIDNKFTLDQVCFTTEELLKQIRENRSTKDRTVCIVFDEAFRGLSSRAALSKVNKQIIQVLMEMREKNLVLFIVSPSFFLIDLYAAMIRSNALFHISKKKGAKQRSFKMFSHKKKAKLYREGIKKGWEYKIYTAFMGRFPGKYPGGEKFEALYREKKRLAGINENPAKKEEEEGKYEDAYNKMVLAKYKEVMSLRKTAEFLSEVLEKPISHVTIKNKIDKFKASGQLGSEINEMLAKSTEKPEILLKVKG